jgi:hypothetical protein
MPHQPANKPIPCSFIIISLDFQMLLSVTSPSLVINSISPGHCSPSGGQVAFRHGFRIRALPLVLLIRVLISKMLWLYRVCMQLRTVWSGRVTSLFKPPVSLSSPFNSAGAGFTISPGKCRVPRSNPKHQSHGKVHSVPNHGLKLHSIH